IYVYNVHSLVHLAQDVRTFGPLDSFSAFPFENYLGQLKRLIRSGNLPLQQAVRRMSERNKTSCILSVSNEVTLLKKEHDKGPVPNNFNGGQYRQLVLKDMFLSTSHGDNCVTMKDGNVILIRNMFK
ncbi:unnamed protein product, partial [Ixodes pacificus]